MTPTERHAQLPPCFICGRLDEACGHREEELLVHYGFALIRNNNDWWKNQRRNGDREVWKEGSFRPIIQRRKQRR